MDGNFALLGFSHTMNQVKVATDDPHARSIESFFNDKNQAPLGDPMWFSRLLIDIHLSRFARCALVRIVNSAPSGLKPQNYCFS